MEHDIAFRGSSPAKIDDKGRLKIPSIFRGIFSAHQSRELFVTSALGDNVRIYPLPAWIDIEKRIDRDLTAPGTNAKTRQALVNFRAATSRWGQMAEIDVQDRVLIHPSLRGEAQTVSEVTVVGAATHLEVWEQNRYVEHCAKHRLTEEDMVELSGLGY
jgi:MraZ protein